MLQTVLRRTPLHHFHELQDAKMTPFGGWEMPLQYKRSLDEHMSVRNAVGLFDVSHMGVVGFKADSIETILEALEPLVPRDLNKRLTPHKAVYTMFMNEAGGIVDDIILYRPPEKRTAFADAGQILMVCNAGNTPAVMSWLKANLKLASGVQFKLLNDQITLVALQGPKFQEVLEQISADIHDIPGRFGISESTILGAPILMARTGYTGEDGIELFLPAHEAEPLWRGLLGTLHFTGIVPVGLGARDTLRTEAALPLHGQDITASISPLEAGLGWCVDLDKPISFIGQAALKEQQLSQNHRQFICFTLTERTIPRPHDVIYLGEEAVGEVTSGTFSPCLNQPIGMGLVKRNNTTFTLGSSIQLKDRRGNWVDAQIVKRPFYNRPTS